MSDSPIRVLLADDHAVVRAGIRQFMERANDIQVIGEVGDGEAAKSFIQQTPIDVAVLDIQMPKASGIEVTRWIRASHHTLGVLVLTAYDDDPYVLAVIKAGANGYVLKTAAPDDIVQAVRDVHDGKSVLDKSVAPKVLAHISGQAQSVPIEPLSDREQEVLTLTAKGFTNKAIGVQLGISDRTVQGHLAHIYERLNVASRTEAVMRAVSLGWLPTNMGELDNA
jgi:DNA-binding NarL/FixJ family response regulator